ncbi:hypothetical protein [Streptomyces sp. NPDC017993]|uniref:hypothetical protein n=1 Tax=Streptomyces sp. NPDC017993 TaxID=3365027 RepID=UPI00378773CE
MPTPASTHPSATPGYGKRSAPDQRPRRPADFAHLPAREASIAAYIDHLPDGSDISVKTLAKVLPDYGQCALRTALRRLSEAGHLRRITEIRGGDGSPRWVTRTYFTRTARDDTWWAALSAGDVPPAQEREPQRAPREPQREPQPQLQPQPQPQPTTPLPQPSAPRTPRSPAYAALAGLGRTDPRMTLSAADCAALEPLAAEWLARGATTTYLTQALTAGLPSPIHHPGNLARSRLVSKLPPEPEPEPAPAPESEAHTPSQAPPPLRLMECTVCAAPGRPEALPGGLCSACRGEAPPPPPGLPPAEVHTHIQRLRAANRPRERSHA